MTKMFDKVSQDFMNAVKGVLEAKKVNKHGHDAVGKEDDDIDNDGDTDTSDKYLHNRRKAIGKAIGMKKESKDDMPFKGPYKTAAERKDEYGNTVKNVAKHLAKKAMNKQKNEEVEQIDELDWKVGGVLNRYGAKVAGDPNRQKGRDLAKRKQYVSAPGTTTPKVRAIAREEVQIDEMSSKMKMKLGLYGKKKKMKEEAEELEELSVNAMKKARTAALSMLPDKLDGSRLQRAQGSNEAGKKILRKGGKLGEEAQQVDEISGDMKSRYKKAASQSMDQAHDFKSELDNEGEPRGSRVRKDVNRIIKNRKIGMKRANEEAEGLDELSTGTMRSYMDKASDARGHRKLSTKKVDNRYAGVQKASSKLAKEEADQVNELSVKKLDQYRTKARQDIIDADDNDDNRMANKRVGGYMAASRKIAKKLAKEDVEQVDELSKKTLGSYVVKSLAPGSEKSVSNLASKGGYKLGKARDDDYTAGEKEDAKSVKRSLGVLTAVRKMTKEDNEQLDEISKATMGRYINKAKNSIDTASYRQGNREALGGSSRPLEKKLTKRHKGISMAVGKLTKEEIEMIEAIMAGVAPGSMEGDQHMCATKIFHKEWAEGTPVKTMHADPDENGLIEWYDVMFDHGIERVMTEDMEILDERMHGHMKKKMKEEAEDPKLLTAIKKKLSDEGGAAGFKPLKDCAAKIGINLTPQMLKTMSGVSQHSDGDYILDESTLDEGEEKGGGYNAPTAKGAMTYKKVLGQHTVHKGNTFHRSFPSEGDAVKYIQKNQGNEPKKKTYSYNEEAKPDYSEAGDAERIRKRQEGDQKTRDAEKAFEKRAKSIKHAAEFLQRYNASKGVKEEVELDEGEEKGGGFDGMPKGLQDRTPRGSSRGAMGRAIAKKERNLARARMNRAATKMGEEVELDEARGRPKKAGQMDYTVHPRTKEKLMHNNPAHMKRIEMLQKNKVLDKPKTEANQHIMNQLQKAKTSMLGGSTIQFTHGQAKHVSGPHAAKLLSKYAGMKPDEKEAFQKKIGHSHEQLMKHV